jgi:hypothetical protein
MNKYVLVLLRVVGIPIMVLLYVGLIVPLSVVWMMDYLFDVVGIACGFDTRFWPLPRGFDEEFRFKKKALHLPQEHSE